MKKTWGGRFKKPTDPRVEAFTESISFDHRLASYDIEGSRAHVQTLVRAKLLKGSEGRKLLKGLQEVLRRLNSGKLPLDASQEDIHTAVERELTRIVGPLGGKLHTGRSRNDQVATDLRLYLRDAVREALQKGTALIETLLVLADREKETLLPGYTHLQRAMPVTMGHHLCAYAFMLLRDMDRFQKTWDRGNALPLGSGALAGTNHAFDRQFTAKVLGLKTVLPNSLDAVSDRDVYVDFLSAAAIAQMHLSRLSEDLILWASTEFGFIEMDDAFATGSSLMPQKKNPDVPELVRGKTGRIFGDLMGLLTVLKGLPMSYNRDLQEDKRFVFDAADTLCASMLTMEGFLSTLRFNRERMESAADEDLTLLATDLADVLVKVGVPFRVAHEVVGRVVHHCLEAGKRLQDLSDAELGRFSDLFPKGTAVHLSAHQSVRDKEALGGTSPKNVLTQVRQVRRDLLKLKKYISEM
jgi:argininosuccinate lyase